MTLTQRLFFLGLLSLLPAAAVVLYLQVELRSARESEALDLVVRQTQQANSEITRIVEGMKTLVTAVASAPSVQSLDKASCTAFLQRVVKNVEHAQGLGVLDLDGNLRCVDRQGQAPLNYRDRPYFQEAIDSGDFVIGTYTHSKLAPGQAILPFAAPIRDDGGKITGVVVVSLNLIHLNLELEKWPRPEGSSLTIADRDGVILARTPLPEKFVGMRIPEEFQKWVHADRPGVGEALSLDGTLRIFSYIPVGPKPKGLYVSSGISKKVAFDYVKSTTRMSWAILLIGVAVMAICIYAAGLYFIRRPVKRLLAVADGWTADPPVGPGAIVDSGEFGEIGKALNRMGAAFVAQRQRELDHQAHLKVLLSELNHRVKNTFTVVQSIVSQGLRASGVDSETRGKIEARLLALAGAHDLLTQDNWSGSSLGELVRKTLGPFGLLGGRANRFEISGEPVHLTPRLTLSLGMTLHELATNAIKYGALSNERGRVIIDWTVTTNEAGRRLHLCWQEVDGPPAAPPASKGFGSRLIEKSISNELEGEVDLSFTSSGVVCELDLLLPVEESVVASHVATAV